LIRSVGRQSAFWVAIGTLVASFLSLAFQAYLAAFLDDADFGAASIVVAVALAVFLSLGSQNYLLDSVKRRGLESRPILASYLRLWALTLGLFIAASVGTSLFLPSFYKQFAFIGSLTLLIALFTILGSARQSVDDFRGVGFYLVSPEVAKCLAVLVVVVLNVATLSGVYFVMAISFTFISLGALAIPAIWRSYGATPKWTSIATFGLPYALSGLLFMAYYRSTIVVFSSFGMLDEAGSLAIIYLFMTAILLLPTTYSQRFLLGRWHSIPRNEPTQFSRELKRQVTLILLLTVPMGIVWFVISPWIIELLYSGRYSLAGVWAPWFAVVFVIRSVCIPMQTAASIGELKWHKTWVVSGAGLTAIVVSIVFANTLGFASSLIAGLAAEGFLCVGLLFIMSRYLRRSQSDLKP
jgi:O-antigen/teichoic acid export membrane protein